MADRTVRISQLAWQRFKQAALDQGITLKAYLERLSLGYANDRFPEKPAHEDYLAEVAQREASEEEPPIAGTHARRLAAREEK